MLNMICITAAELLDKAKEAGIVIAIGVGMVFVILGLIIGVVKVLKFINIWMNAWDAHMMYVRECKAEIAKIKVANNDHFSHEKGAILAAKGAGDLTEAQANEALAKLSTDKASAKNEFLKDKKQIHIKFDTVFNIIKEANFRIKKLVKAEKEEYTASVRAIDSSNKKEEITALKTARILKRVELNNLIKIEENERDARIALAKAGMPVPANESHGSKAISDNQQLNVTDSKIIAAITAAITMMMSEEGIAKKAGFKVRSIKLVK